MSQIAILGGCGTTSSDVEKLTGMVGGPVGVDAAFNINLFTTDGLTSVGTPLTHTITFSPANDLAAIEALNTTGVASRTGVETWTISPITQNAVVVGGAGQTLSNIGPLTNGQLVMGSTGAAPVAASLTAGSGVSIVNGSGSISISATGGGFSWVDATNVSYTLSAQTGYITNRGAGVTYTLPATGTIGDTIKIVGKLGLATIAQNANQQIVIGNTNTTLGVGGSLTATNVGDCLELVCITAGANTVWRTDSGWGNWTVV